MEVIEIGNCMATRNRDNPNQGRVYDQSGLCPCLTNMNGGGRQPMIVETVRIKQATEKGYIECEVGVGGRPILSHKHNEERKGSGDG